MESDGRSLRVRNRRRLDGARPAAPRVWVVLLLLILAPGVAVPAGVTWTPAIDAATGAARTKPRLEVEAAPGPGPAHLRLAQARVDPKAAEEARRQTVDPRTLEQLQLRLVIVPDVRGQTVRQATETLKRAGLGRGGVQRFEGNVEREEVVRQSPGAGSRARPGTAVDLYVAVPAGVIVPNVVGMPEERAWKTLVGAGLEPGGRFETPSRERPGRVVEQKPRGGERVGRGTPVTLAIAVAAGIEMPGLIGLPERDARAILEEIGLRAGPVERLPAGEPPGTVLRQTPSPGERVEPGTSVRLWVAAEARVEMPDLRGRSERQAWQIVEERGLVPAGARRMAADAPAGTVVRQEPAPGALVGLRAPVRIWLAERPPRRMPELVGLDERDARATIERSELRIGEVGELDADARPGTVVRQDPPPGAAVEPGQFVRIWLAARRLPEVPDLVGLTESEARDWLRELKIDLEVAGSEVADIRPDTVVRQRPAAGRTAEPGLTVAVWLAEPGPVAVPDVTGMPEGEAWSLIQRAALGRGSAESITSNTPVGRVLEQSPVAGTRVDRGTPVDLVVSGGSQVEVPDLIGLTPREAARRVQDANLRFRVENRVPDHLGPTVATQRPRAGVRVPPEMTVHVTLVAREDEAPGGDEDPVEPDAPDEPDRPGGSAGPDEPPYVGEPPGPGAPEGGGPGGGGRAEPGWPWGTLGAVAVVGLALGFVAREVLRRLFRRAAVRMRPVRDLGSAGFEGVPPGLAGPAFELRARADPGSQAVSPAAFVEPEGDDEA